MKFTIKALRVNKGLTLEQAARKLDISVTTLINWESGKTFPKVNDLQNLEQVLGVGYDMMDFNVKYHG